MAENEDWRKDKPKFGGSIKIIKGNIYARIQYIDETTGKRKEILRRAENRTTAHRYLTEIRSEL